MDQNQMLQFMLLAKLLNKKKKEAKVQTKPSSDELPSMQRYSHMFETIEYSKHHPDACLFYDIFSHVDMEAFINQMTCRCASSALTAPFEYEGTTQSLKSHMLEFAQKHSDFLICHVFDVPKGIKNGVYEIDWNFGSRVPLFDCSVEAVNFVSNPINLDAIEFSVYIREIYSFMWDAMRHCKKLYELAGRDKSYVSKVVYKELKFLVIDGKAICCDITFDTE